MEKEGRGILRAIEALNGFTRNRPSFGCPTEHSDLVNFGNFWQICRQIEGVGVCVRVCVSWFLLNVEDNHP